MTRFRKIIYKARVVQSGVICAILTKLTRNISFAMYIINRTVILWQVPMLRLVLVVFFMRYEEPSFSLTNVVSLSDIK